MKITERLNQFRALRDLLARRPDLVSAPPAPAPSPSKAQDELEAFYYLTALLNLRPAEVSPDSVHETIELLSESENATVGMVAPAVAAEHSLPRARLQDRPH